MNPTLEEIRSGIACEKEIVLASGHFDGKRRLYALLSISTEGSYGLHLYVEIDGVKTECNGLGNATRLYCEGSL